MLSSCRLGEGWVWVRLIKVGTYAAAGVSFCAIIIRPLSYSSPLWMWGLGMGGWQVVDGCGRWDWLLQV